MKLEDIIVCKKGEESRLEIYVDREKADEKDLAATMFALVNTANNEERLDLENVFKMFFALIMSQDSSREITKAMQDSFAGLFREIEKNTVKDISLLN